MLGMTQDKTWAKIKLLAKYESSWYSAFRTSYRFSGRTCWMPRELDCSGRRARGFRRPASLVARCPLRVRSYSTPKVDCSIGRTPPHCCLPAMIKSN